MGTKRNDTIEQAGNGGVIIDDTSATTGTFGGLLVINTAVISAITAPSVTNSAGLTSITLDAGLYLPLNFSSITLTSGVVYAINDYS